MIRSILLFVNLIIQVTAAITSCCGDPMTDEFDVEVLRIFYNEEVYSENHPKCLPVRRWTHALSPYSMVCYRHADIRYVITVYHGREIIDSAEVRRCDKNNQMARSVSVAPPEGSTNTHTVQYILHPNLLCKRVSYRADKTYNIGACKRINQPDQYNSHGYKHGWKEEEVNIDKYVKEFTTQSIVECQYKIGWKCPVEDVLLQCYDCNDDLIGTINYKGTTLAAVTVFSCLPPLQESFRVVSAKKDAPDVIGIQFRKSDGTCVRRNFNLKEKVQVGGEEGCSKSSKSSNSWRRLVCEQNSL